MLIDHKEEVFEFISERADEASDDNNDGDEEEADTEMNS